MAETISGRVSRVVYNQEDFYILAMHVVESDPPVAKRTETARGSLFGLLQVKRGVSLQLIGEWVEDKKYGRQFMIRSWEPWAEEVEDVGFFLHTSIDGFVDQAMADALAAEYGLGAFMQLSERPVAVRDFLVGDRCNTEPDEAEGALLGWQQTLATRDLSVLLRTGGIGPLEIQAAVRKFGTEAAGLINANPYRLMEIPQFPFLKVEKLAREIGVGADDIRRVEGAILWAIHEAALAGHLFLSRGQVVPQVTSLLNEHRLVAVTRGDPKPAFLEALRNLIARKALVLDGDAGLYVPELYFFERESARILAELAAPEKLEVDIEPFLAEYERGNQITLSTAQRLAVDHLTRNRVLVLTGLPGTGKTTAIRVLVRVFEEARIPFALMAPTGIASKRLAAVTGHQASTIHRALKFDGTNWGRHADNRFLHEAVIVDEMSMVDQELLYRLLVALRPETRLVLVGDDAQLPSVGPGNVLRELADCPDLANVRLTEIFRQSHKGEIVLNAHRINRGESLSFPDDPKETTEFKFVRMSDEEAIARLIVQMASRLKSRDANFQVLAPKYDGTVGVTSLNERLRDQLNPEGPREWVQGSKRFRLGDRLMVIQNDYKRNVYNGDVGKLVHIGRNQLIVKIHDVGEEGLDMEVEFDDHAAEEKLQLAYAITVHKSQGSEFDTIILPIMASQGRMLQRNLLYTAVTRARKRVWLIGEEVAIQRAINNNRVIRRNTALARAVHEAVASGVLGNNEGEDDESTRRRTNAGTEGAAEPPGN